MREPVVAPKAVDTQKQKARFQPDLPLAWVFVLVVGGGLALVGVIDVGLLFTHARWASLDWEFGTVSAMIDGMPLITIGCGAMAAATVARGWHVGRKLLAPVFVLITLGVLASLVVFLLDVPPALKAMDPLMRPLVMKVILKTGTMGATYVVVYSLLAALTWRRRRLGTLGNGA